MQLPIQVGLETARLRGEVLDVLIDETRPVDGVYEISTIRVELASGRSRRETVAFKVSGVGPQQITEPYYATTLTITAA